VTSDTGISSKKSVYGPTKKLVMLGFLLQKKQALRFSSFETVNTYQRPTVEYTVAKLLRARKISADLIPLNVNGTLPSVSRIQAYQRTHGTTVRTALEKMVGEETLGRIATLMNERQRADQLATALETRVDALKAENKTATEAKGRRARSAAKRARKKR
jgi:hypothetical protein